MKVKEKDYCVEFKERKQGDVFRLGIDGGYFIKVKDTEIEDFSFLAQKTEKIRVNAMNLVTGNFNQVPNDQFVRFYEDAVLLLGGRE